MKRVVEEGEIVSERIEAEKGIVSIERGVCFWSRLLDRFYGFVGDGIVLEVVVGVVEGSIGFWGHSERDVRNAVGVARPSLANTIVLGHWWKHPTLTPHSPQSKSLVEVVVDIHGLEVPK